MLAQGGEGALACVRRLGSPVTYRRREGGCPFSPEAPGGRAGCFLAGVPQLPAPPPRPARRFFWMQHGCGEEWERLPSFLQAEKVKATGHVND